MPLDPDAQAVIDLIKMSGRPPFHTMTPEEARTAYRRARDTLAPEPQAVSMLRDFAIPGLAGDIPARLYRAAGAPDGPLPGLIFFHGGGWVIGDLETHDTLCRHLANAGRCAVVAIDYRLGPEHRFPAAVEDCIAATLFIATSGASLGIDSSKLAVGGDSAGGSLAAVMAHLSRDGELPPLVFQLLIYPTVDLAASYEPRDLARLEDLPFNEKTIAYFLKHYVDEAQRTDWRASPLRATNFKGLPPAFVLTAGYDPLCREGEAYAEKLTENGGRVMRLHLNDQVHGFITQGRIVRAAITATEMAGLALRRAFRT